MSERDQVKRRELLGSGALAAASALLAGFAVACSDDGDEKSVPTGDGGIDGGNTQLDAGTDATTPVDAGAQDADVATLNALLIAEYSAIAAYTAGAGILTNSIPETDPLNALKPTIIAIASNILEQHKLHAIAVADAVTKLGGAPVSQGSITFTPPAGLAANITIKNILKFATGAERNAAIAYNKAVEKLEASKHRYLASAIEGDESQHFIILAALVLGLADPGPNLTPAKGPQLPPKAFVRTVGTQGGLETLTAYYPAS